MRGRHRLAAATGGLCLLLGPVLVGCGGNGEPQPLPKPTASFDPSEPESAPPTPPVMPSAAKEKTKAGAIGFVQHYVDVLNYATFTGRTDEARGLDGGRCKSCNRMLASIDAIYEAGGRVTGGAWRPTPVSQVKRPGNEWIVDTKINYGPQVVVENAGGETKNYTGGGRLVSFIVEYSADGWRVAEWTRAT